MEEIDTNKIRVTTSTSIRNPVNIDEKISSPFESLFYSLEGVTNVQSISGIGFSKIIIELSEEYDEDLFRFLLSNAVKSHFSKLPHGTQYPVITKDSDLTNKTPAISYSVYTPNSLGVAKDESYLKDYLRSELMAIPGIEKVDLQGIPKTEIVISLSRAKMNQYKITNSFIAQKLSSLNKEVSISSVSRNGTIDSYVLSMLPDSKLNDIFLKVVDDVAIVLGDVATISKQEKRKEFIYRVNGNDNIVLNIFTKDGSNSIKVVDAVKKKIQSMVLRDSRAPKFHLNFDNTEKLKIEISNIILRICLSFSILCILIMLVYFDRRIVIIFLSVIFASFAINICLYSIFDILINIYSLAGIAISFGLLIDNVLVVNDHFVKYGNLRVFKPILTSTLTTIVSLSLIYFLPQNTQNNLMSFSSVIIINLASSIVSAFLFIPLLHAYFPIKNKAKKVSKSMLLFTMERVVYKVNQFRVLIIILSIFLFGLPIYLIPANVFSKSSYFVEFVKPKLDYALGGVSHLFYKNIYKNAKGLRTKENKNKILVNIKLPVGSSILHLNEVLQYFEEFIKKYHPTKIDYFISKLQNSEFGNLQIGLKDDMAFAGYLNNMLANLSKSIGGAQISILGVGPGFVKSNSVSSKRFKVFFKGFNNETINDFANEFIELIRENPRIDDINANANLDASQDKLFSFVFEQEKESSNNLDLSNSSLQETLYQFDASNTAVAVSVDNQDVVIKNDAKDGNSLWSIQNQSVYLDSIEVNLKNIGKLKKQIAKRSINKYNQSYVKAVEWSYNGSQRFGSNFLKQKVKEFENRLPLGYYIEIDNKKIDLIDSNLFKLIFIVLFLIFLICAIHFESIFLAFLVILLVPMSYIGIFLIFYLGDFVFDQGGVASFIIVSGITVNSLILILTEFTKHKENGKSNLDNYLFSLNDKIKPIFLTVITSIFGLLPFIIFAEKEPFWFSLSIGMIGGLLFSLISLVAMIPAFLLKTITHE